MMLQIQSPCLGRCGPLAKTAVPRLAPIAAASGVAAATYPTAGNNGHSNGTPVASVTTATPIALPAAPAMPPAPAPAPGVLPPPAAYQAVVAAGAIKASLPAWKAFLQGIQAGAYVALGGFIAVSVGGTIGGLAAGAGIGLQKLMSGLVFPIGLLITVVCGGELFTGNTAFIPAAVYEKKANVGGMINNWVWSYLGNFAGSLLMVALVAATGLLATNQMPINMAVAKTSLTFGQAFCRAILCNWLVCAAVWMAAASTTMSGKVLSCWLPAMTFVTLSLEHSVANMYFIFMGVALGAPVTIMDVIVKNLIPVTLGNMFAGIVLMATVYAFAYGSLGKPKEQAAAA